MTGGAPEELNDGAARDCCGQASSFVQTALYGSASGRPNQSGRTRLRLALHHEPSEANGQFRIGVRLGAVRSRASTL